MNATGSVPRRRGWDGAARSRLAFLQRVPLALDTGMFWLIGAGLVVLGLIPLALTWRSPIGDWHAFAGAGARVGTAALLHPASVADAFAYMPGFAWVLVPAAHVTATTGILVNAVLMMVCAVVAGAALARAHGLRAEAGALLACAWAPVTYAATIGQNSAFGAMLAALSIAGFARDSWALAAIPAGLLLYKPTYAIPLLVVIALRRRPRELVVVACMAVAWYAASVAATGGDVAWPSAWFHEVARYVAPDFAFNADKALSIPGLLARAGAPAWITVVVLALVAVAAVPAFRAARIVEAASMACAFGLVASPHAWGYDGAFALPLVFVAVTRLAEPLRTRIIGAAYVTAPLVLFCKAVRFDVIAVSLVGGALVWIAARWCAGATVPGAFAAPARYTRWRSESAAPSSRFR